MKIVEQKHNQEEGQYSKESIDAYEWMFGEGFISAGGADTANEVISHLQLKPGHRVLDVGCGLGGHDFLMAENYGAIIDGVDLSKNMLVVARNHLCKKTEAIANSINFRICDVTITEFEADSYNAIYSRDAILHIAEKEQLFTKFYKWLKPGGKLVFTDYCLGEAKEHSEEFKNYVTQRGYSLINVASYEQLIKKVGFCVNIAEDRGVTFHKILAKELQNLYDSKETFLQKFSMKSFESLEKGWLAKLERNKRGEQTWILCCAEKPV